jgi:DNA-binding IclR family transcriptional regulator
MREKTMTVGTIPRERTMADSPNTIKAARTTFEVIEALQRLDGAGVTELAEYLGRSTTGVHKHLTTLRELGYVVQEGTTYSLGLKFLLLGRYVQEQETLYTLVRDEIDNLSDITRMTVSLVVQEGDEAVHVYVSRGDATTADATVRVQEGDRAAMTDCVAGKAMLAYTEQEGDVGADLRGELDEIRSQQLAIGQEPAFDGVWSVAVPILDTDDRPLGAVNVAGTDNFSRKRVEQHTAGQMFDTVNSIRNQFVNAERES